jgi:uncharacterized protein
MSSLRLIAPDAFRTTPWRNGGGTTCELLIHPDRATVGGAFDWRLSMAQVATSGPFSTFEGVDRSLLLLEGGGMVLDFGAQGQARLEGPLEPVVFPGEWACMGTLRAGPCRDFNVMTRRAVCRHELEVAVPGTRLRPADTLLVFACFGPVTVGDTQVPAGHLLRLEGNTEPLRLRGEPYARALVVRIEAVVETWPSACVGRERSTTKNTKSTNPV